MLLLGIGAIVWIWLDSARAREFANTLAERYCTNRGLQFLDQTVSLSRVGVRWTSNGLRIRRMFRFDFSLEGVGRRTGYVLMLGSTLESIEDGLPSPAPDPEKDTDTDTGAEKPATERHDSKVLPFKRKD